MNCILPLGLYFALSYKTSLPQQTIIPIITAIIGTPTLGLWIPSSWKLFHAEIIRPLGSLSRWALDYFHWHLTIGIVYMAVVLALASRAPSDLCLFSSMLPLIILHCCVQFVFLELSHMLDLRTPFPFSSVKTGSSFPAGVVLLAEDTFAVDGNIGRTFRSALHQRIAASPPLLYRILNRERNGLLSTCNVAVSNRVIFKIPCVRRKGHHSQGSFVRLVRSKPINCDTIRVKGSQVL